MDKERKKIRLMQISISLVVVIIFFLWISNIGNVFERNKQTGNNVNSEWQEFKKDLDKTFDVADSYFSDKIENLDPKQQDNEATTTVINKIIKEVEEEAKQDQPATPTPVEPAPEKEIKNNCPAWINCMPSYDSPVRPCQIPPGCEGITQIAY